MTALSQIDIIDETANLGSRIVQAALAAQRNFCFFDSSDRSLSISVLFGVPDFGHTDFTPDLR
jgi:hypothetical protein